ncbi:hypothetical protein [Streptomyces sp. NBC_01240]|uniref:hypothetical protein n=1 Tax=Streptomyces sp. NBC_01240 TaxID=2903793 RepID=UPI002E0FF67A|nr:hypothetical protein OG466_14845 [Streptomyces sp. NBC_01240]
MSEPDDPLRSLFKEAAATGRSRARSAPLSYITAHGQRVRRHRILVLAVGACLVFSGTGAAVATFLSGSTRTTVPATTPSAPQPSPMLSPPRTSPPPTGAPSPGRSASGTPATPTRSASGTPATPTRSASETPGTPTWSASTRP